MSADTTHPCTTAWPPEHDPSRFKWGHRPALDCSVGVVAATVTEASPSPPIDHVALSVGRPDGLYVAGKQLRPWLTFEERQRVVFPTYADRHHYEAMLAAWVNESATFRWRIEDGHPGVLQPLWADVHDGKERKRVAYTWGKQDHVHVHKLGYLLVGLATAEMRVSDASERAYDQVHDLVAGLDSEFVLAVADVCRIVAVDKLRLAEKRLKSAQVLAEKWGAL